MRAPRKVIGTGTLLFIVALTPRFLCAQVTSTGQTQLQYPAPQQAPIVPTAEQCAANPNTPGCDQSLRNASALSVQQTALPNSMNPPPSISTGPSPAAEQPSNVGSRQSAPSQPPTEFQLMVADSVGRMLPIYGSSLFRKSPSTFAPLLNVPVPATYVIGPGDELYIQIWGQVNVELHASVDRDGAIYIPKLGSITVAGVQYGDLSGFLRQRIARIYRNFDITVTLGKLRAIDIYVTGDARAPGRYTISSLSTLVNAVFATGGPSSAGSMRHIEVERNGKVISDFDMYDLLLKGDKSNDVQLLPGDVIYIPRVGAQVAIAGSVNVPAIYELRGDTASLADAISLAGGLNEVADATRLTVERIDNHEVRSVTEYSFKDAETERVKGGDVVDALPIVPKFDNAVTLRGNVANPGRYPWHPGMKICDLIPDKQMLLTRSYWQAENRLVKEPGTEPGLANSAVNDATPEQAKPLALQQEGTPTAQTGITGSRLRTEVKLGAPEINWDYAVIQRLDPVDLSTHLIPFSLRKAVLEHDPDANLSLEPDDVVTIFSQRDMAVSQAKQTLFVRIEGEVNAPGVYRVQHGQTLRDLLKMAGGLTPNAYLYGAQFSRESARTDQQAALDRTARELEEQVREQSIANARSNPDEAASLAAQSQAREALVRDLQTAKATGRVVLALRPTDDSPAMIPPIILEDGDRLFIPPKSQVVSVVGSVFNQSSFVYRRNATVDYYLQQSGNGDRNADMKHVFLVRANGSVLSGSVREYGWWSRSVKSLDVLPGDVIVIPPKLQVGGTAKAIRDWATVASQAAVGAAVIAVH